MRSRHRGTGHEHPGRSGTICICGRREDRDTGSGNIWLQQVTAVSQNRSTRRESGHLRHRRSELRLVALDEGRSSAVATCVVIDRGAVHGVDVNGRNRVYIEVDRARRRIDEDHADTTGAKHLGRLVCPSTDTALTNDHHSGRAIRVQFVCLAQSCRSGVGCGSGSDERPGERSVDSDRCAGVGGSIAQNDRRFVARNRGGTDCGDPRCGVVKRRRTRSGVTGRSGDEDAGCCCSEESTTGSRNCGRCCSATDREGENVHPILDGLVNCRHRVGREAGAERGPGPADLVRCDLGCRSYSGNQAI